MSKSRNPSEQNRKRVEVKGAIHPDVKPNRRNGRVVALNRTRWDRDWRWVNKEVRGETPSRRITQ